jgi:hypothetical protein
MKDRLTVGKQPTSRLFVIILPRTSLSAATLRSFLRLARLRKVDLHRTQAWSGNNSAWFEGAKVLQEELLSQLDALLSKKGFRRSGQHLQEYY